MASLANFISPTFDSSAAVASSNDGQPLPAGIYTVEITGSDIKALKSGNGTGLQVEFTVIDPEQHAKRKVWTNLNLQHSNEQAQEIGQRDFGLLCQAVGIKRPNDTDELFGRILKIKTRVKEAQGQYAARADVQAYMSAGAAPAAQAKPASSASAQMPWQKRA